MPDQEKQGTYVKLFITTFITVVIGLAAHQAWIFIFPEKLSSTPPSNIYNNNTVNNLKEVKNDKINIPSHSISSKTDKPHNKKSSIDDIPPELNLINEQNSPSDIAVLILDSQNTIDAPLGSSIAELYKDKGYSVSNSLFTSNFANSNYFQKVQNGDYNAIQKLKLPLGYKYIILGKYNNEFDEGSYTKYISRAKLQIAVISCETKSQLTSFELHVANGYNDKDHAEEGAIEKLIQDYKTNHLNL